MERDELRDYVEQATGVLEENPGMNEATTKLKLIQEFIDTLGWDITGDIEAEYPVTVGSATHHVDYALRVTKDGPPEILVEAKGSATDLTSDHRDQLRSYMLVSDVRFGILTNGQTYEFFWRHAHSGEVSVHALGVLDIEDLSDAYDLVEIFTFEQLESREAEQQAKELHEYNHATVQLEQNRETLISEFTKLAVDIGGDVLADEAEEVAADAVDKIIRAAQNQGTEGTEEPERRREAFWAKIERETGIENRTGAVILPDGRPATSSFVNFVEYLLREGYITDSDVGVG